MDIPEFLSKLGLTKEETEIYVALTRRGAMTLLELSRIVKLPRTSLYRQIERLKDLGLASEIVDEHRRLVRANPPDRLGFLVAKRSEEVQALETLLPEARRALASEVTEVLGTKVLFYRGQNGIQQILWNSLSAKSEIVGYAYLAYEDVVGKQFARKYREERVRKRIKKRELLSSDDPYLSAKAIAYVRSHPEYFSNAEFRYLPKEILKINHEMMIYPGVVAFYAFENQKEDLFGIEIHNASIVKLQKQIFETLWKISASPEEVLKRKR